MAFSDIIKKLADSSQVLTQTEKDELYMESRRLEEAASLFNNMVIPGSSSLKVDRFVANNAQINDAVINSAIAGGGDVSIDGEGIWIRNQQAAFGFEDTNGDRFKMTLLSDGTDNIVIHNESGGDTWGQGEGHTRISVDTKTSHHPLYFYFKEADADAEVPELKIINTIPNDYALITLASGVDIWSGKDGKQTVFNDDRKDIDFRVKSVNDHYAIFLDAANENLCFFGTPNQPTTLLNLDNGSEKRFEFGADHFIPIRGSSNPNIYFNEANQDMDFHIEGTTDAYLFHSDAGLNGIGIGVPAESAIKLNVYGDTRVDGVLKVGSATSDIQMYKSGSKIVFKYVDAGTTRYKYLDMAGTGVTWVHTTVAP